MHFHRSLTYFSISDCAGSVSLGHPILQKLRINLETFPVKMAEKATLFQDDSSRGVINDNNNNNGKVYMGGVTQKLCYSAGLHISLCTIHFYDYFAKYRNLAKNVASGKMEVVSIHPKALAKSLRP